MVHDCHTTRSESFSIVDADIVEIDGSLRQLFFVGVLFSVSLSVSTVFVHLRYAHVCFCVSAIFRLAIQAPKP